MRVAYLSFDFAEYSVRLVNALARYVEVFLMLPRGEAKPYLNLLDKAVRFHPFAAPRLRQPLRQFQMVARLIEEIRNYSPDVFHLQQGHLFFNLGLSSLPRCGLVLTVHDCHHHPGDAASKKTPQWLLERGYRQADEVIVHSQYVKDQLITLCRIPAWRVSVIPHIALGDAGKKEQDLQSPPTVLFFGRIWEYKGLEYLIRAEPFITAEVPNVRIVIAGQGEALARYRLMMVHPEHFEVHNQHISEQQCAELFKQASVVTLPYIEASQSGVIPIAYTYSKPVVATNVGGLPEMVSDGQTGFCVPPRDERALANAIIRILKDRDLAQRLGANAHRRISTECSPDHIAQQTFAVYRRAAHRRFRYASNSIAS